MIVNFTNLVNGTSISLDVSIVPRIDDNWILPQLGWVKITRVEIDVRDEVMNIAVLCK